MSYAAVAWALEVRTNSAPAKAVLLVLAHRANDDAVCWPTQPRIADDTELSRATVQRAIALLVKQGCLSIEKRRAKGRWQGHQYKLAITVPQPAARQSAAPQSEADQASQRGTDQASQRGHESTVEESKEVKGARSRARATRGTRISEGWKPSERNRTDAKSLGLFERDVDRTAPRFRDYFLQQPGQKGIKLDWDATWRNWCAREAESLGRKPLTTASVRLRPFVKVDSPQWQAWREHWMAGRGANGLIGSTPPYTYSREHKCDGWHFETEWPPDHELKAAA